ncbi:MAG: hypothetical protein CM1200mP35_04100 [Chloroflexota bacterium]|nr:MAG: hypothetical protein CM1200mP35_04100 [Chloroflexota bacterium]
MLEKITAYEQAVITTTDQDVVELHFRDCPGLFSKFSMDQSIISARTSDGIIQTKCTIL